uniref:Uncharacterized protein n=1 Tax=mine drainage metagenome TaxID=410659 RepID=E6QSQ6_9ZZZZ
MERRIDSDMVTLYLLHKSGFQLHCTDAINFAINIMVALNDADIFHFSADFDHG